VYAGGHYSINRERAFDCDVDEFESSLAAAGRARPASAGLPDLRRAIAAYGGDFLAGMTVGEWAHARRDELRRRFETALLATGRLHMAAGNLIVDAALRHSGYFLTSDLGVRWAEKMVDR
jgi:two-component SAPR family response regulator